MLIFTCLSHAVRTALPSGCSPDGASSTEPMPPTLCIADDSKCSSVADDCCACDASIGQTTCGLSMPGWEEPATCRDGYVAVPTPGADGGMHGNPSCEYSCYPPGCDSSLVYVAEHLCPITRSFCTRSPSLPDNCNCGDCGYPACGDCDCDAYGDTSCCYSSWEGGQPTATPSTSCLDSWAVGLTYIGDKGPCRDVSLELCGTAYRRRSDGTYARCEVSSGQCSTINGRSMEGGTLDENGKLRFTCHQPAPSVPFVVRPSPLELSPRHRPAPPLSRLRRYPLPPPLSPAPTPGDDCPSACTARRSPPSP